MENSGAVAMFTNNRTQTHDTEWEDAVMRKLPRMYRMGQVSGRDDYLFVYATTFFSAKEELRRGATHHEMRRQRRRILRYIDKVQRSEHDKELFAAPFARAFDDALAGRSPCILQPPQCADEVINAGEGRSLDILTLLYHVG
jgi:hypothetical protein